MIKKKACALETLVASVPSLQEFDDFIRELCGGRCLRDCGEGFPLSLLDSYTKCLRNGMNETVSHSLSENDQNICLNSMKEPTVSDAEIGFNWFSTI